MTDTRDSDRPTSVLSHDEIAGALSAEHTLPPPGIEDEGSKALLARLDALEQGQRKHDDWLQGTAQRGGVLDACRRAESSAFEAAREVRQLTDAYAVDRTATAGTWEAVQGKLDAIRTAQSHRPPPPATMPPTVVKSLAAIAAAAVVSALFWAAVATDQLTGDPAPQRIAAPPPTAAAQPATLVNP